MPVNGKDFGLDSDLLPKFPGECASQRLADLDNEVG
jgi:hypothetical protein